MLKAKGPPVLHTNPSLHPPLNPNALLTFPGSLSCILPSYCFLWLPCSWALKSHWQIIAPGGPVLTDTTASCTSFRQAKLCLIELRAVLTASHWNLMSVQPTNFRSSLWLRGTARQTACFDIFFTIMKLEHQTEAHLRCVFKRHMKLFSVLFFLLW